jgi:4-hydroxy-3-methylbut-2-enyl diphosphate reductase
MSPPVLNVLLASPRGFCAGVVRALDTVEALLRAHGPPLHVHHDIVHNPHVVRELEARGVVFVDDPGEVPEGAIMLVSAHGAAPRVFAAARARALNLIDATCPLVTKVHREVQHHVRRGRRVVLIGHRGHAETIGTAGHAGAGVQVVETAAEAEALPLDPAAPHAYATQTTLSPADTAEIVAVLERRLPDLAPPPSADICYATENRQAAVQAIAPRVEAMAIVGGANSSNSCALAELARRQGCRTVLFAARGRDIDIDALAGCRTLGISSGASTPEPFVDELLERLAARFTLSVETVHAAHETAFFNLPPLARTQA